MAYSTGTASDIDDLINVKLKAFAIANGWTVNEDNWPTFISLSKGTCFVNFQRYLASGTDPFGYPYTDHRLYARISSGYGPGGFTGQPNVAAYNAIANDRYEGQAGTGAHAFLFASSSINNFQLYIGGADSQEPVKVGTQVLEIFRPFNTLESCLTSSSAGHFADAVHSLGLNPINGVTPFLPAPLLVDFPSNVEAFFPLGRS
jgi:hypothetical protein